MKHERKVGDKLVISQNNTIMFNRFFRIKKICKRYFIVDNGFKFSNKTGRLMAHYRGSQVFAFYPTDDIKEKITRNELFFEVEELFKKLENKMSSIELKELKRTLNWIRRNSRRQAQMSLLFAEKAAEETKEIY